ncbi:MAG: HAD-IA family hydrolase [Rubrivivax sp.]|nr:HAD-IA family hydrolase [Rubrivivax sp.]
MTSTADQATLLRAVAFDLDGTLIDSAPDIAHALNEALHEAGLARVDLAQVHAWIGDGPDVLIARALQALDQPPAPALQQSLRQAFDRVTLQQPLTHGALFDGVAALLPPLRAQWPLVVVTNKPSRLARAVLDAAGVLPHFAAVHGADTAAWRKPAPVLLQRAAAELGLPASALLMVGDSAADLGAAAAAGAAAAFATWGYGAPTLTARWRLDRPADLLGILPRA